MPDIIALFNEYKNNHQRYTHQRKGYDKYCFILTFLRPLDQIGLFLCQNVGKYVSQGQLMTVFGHGFGIQPGLRSEPISAADGFARPLLPAHLPAGMALTIDVGRENKETGSKNPEDANETSVRAVRGVNHRWVGKRGFTPFNA